MAEENAQQSDLLSILRQRRRRPRTLSHNHRPLRQILRELNIGPIERFLLWLSKTDFYVLWLSTYHTRLTLSSLGMMVLFTSFLAFSSAYYALSTTLIPPDSRWGWLIVLVLSLLYAFGIMIIDREIVGSISRKSFAIRLFFAIFIATAISWPVKLKFFEGRIENEIDQIIEERNADKIARIEQLAGTGERERQLQIEQIKKRLNSLDKEISVLDKEISKEASIVRCGPKCERLRSEKAALMAQFQAAENELDRLARPANLPAEQREEITRLRNEISKEREISYDFLTKWEALDRLKEENPNYWILSGFIFLFFMLLELVPLILKWSIGKTEYHYYLESRDNLNTQKIVSLTNMFIEEMQQDPLTLIEMIPHEVTDIIAMHIEDEARDTTYSNAPIRNIRDIIRSQQNRERNSAGSSAPDRASAADSATGNPGQPRQDPNTSSNTGQAPQAPVQAPDVTDEEPSPRA